MHVVQGFSMRLQLINKAGKKVHDGASVGHGVGYYGVNNMKKCNTTRTTVLSDQEKSNMHQITPCQLNSPNNTSM